MSNVVVISRAKNEADIIEPWVRHTLAHVDRLVVSENDSSDNTLAILEALKAEGLPLTILQEKTVGDYQSAVFTRLMREQAPAASWIVPLDTDEFIETPVDVRFADLLEAGPKTIRALPWKSFAWMWCEESTNLNPVERLPYRLVEETFYQKISVPQHLALANTLCTGSHFLLPSGDAGTLVNGCVLGHFPLRSVDQYRLKASMAYLQSACVPGWDRRCGFQFSSLPDTANIEEQALAKYSQRYASQKPLDWQPQLIRQPLSYRGGPLRYTTREDRFIPTILRFSETLALKIAEYAGKT